MTPKRTAIIMLIILLVTAALLAFLYMKKQAFGPTSGQLDAGSRPLSPQELLEQKINGINQRAKKNPDQYPPDKVRQEIIEVINDEIIIQEQNKTPEQKAADLKAEEERQKIIDQINRQIRNSAGANKE